MHRASPTGPLPARTGGAPLSLPHVLKTWKNRALNTLGSIAANPHPEPVFIAGHQKSGTTAIARLLAAALGERCSIDLSYRLGWRDMASVCNGRVPVPLLVQRARREFACAVIKDPDFSFIVPQLHAYFPAARFILIVRDPRQTIRSILNRLDLPGHLAGLGDRRDALERLPGWPRIFDPAVFGFASTHYVEVLAERWCLAVRRAGGIPDRLRIVKYEAFLDGKAAFVRELADWLHRPVRHDIDAIVDRPFQPRGNPGLDLLEFFGLENLARIETICGPLMQRHGYPRQPRRAVKGRD